eukprot:8996489-Alexandrium_andersonii.AAC.1
MRKLGKEAKATQAKLQEVASTQKEKEVLLNLRKLSMQTDSFAYQLGMLMNHGSNEKGESMKVSEVQKLMGSAANCVQES